MQIARHLFPLFFQHSVTRVWTFKSSSNVNRLLTKNYIEAKVSENNKVVLFLSKIVLGVSVLELADHTLTNPCRLVTLQMVAKAVRGKSKDADDVEDGEGGDHGAKGSEGLDSEKLALQQLCLLLQSGHLVKIQISCGSMRFGACAVLAEICFTHYQLMPRRVTQNTAVSNCSHTT